MTLTREVYEAIVGEMHKAALAIQPTPAQADAIARAAMNAVYGALRNPTPEMIEAVNALPITKQIDSALVYAALRGVELKYDVLPVIQEWQAALDASPIGDDGKWVAGSEDDCEEFK